MISSELRTEPKTCKVYLCAYSLGSVQGGMDDQIFHSNLRGTFSRLFGVRVLGDLGWKPAVPTLPPVQNGCLN